MRKFLNMIFGKKYKVVFVREGFSAIHGPSNGWIPEIVFVNAQMPFIRHWELIKYVQRSVERLIATVCDSIGFKVPSMGASKNRMNLLQVSNVVLTTKQSTFSQ